MGRWNPPVRSSRPLQLGLEIKVLNLRACSGFTYFFRAVILQSAICRLMRKDDSQFSAEGCWEQLNLNCDACESRTACLNFSPIRFYVQDSKSYLFRLQSGRWENRHQYIATMKSSCRRKRVTTFNFIVIQSEAEKKSWSRRFSGVNSLPSRPGTLCVLIEQRARTTQIWCDTQKVTFIDCKSNRRISTILETELCSRTVIRTSFISVATVVFEAIASCEIVSDFQMALHFQYADA